MQIHRYVHKRILNMYTEKETSDVSDKMPTRNTAPKWCRRRDGGAAVSGAETGRRDGPRMGGSQVPARGKLFPALGWREEREVVSSGPRRGCHGNRENCPHPLSSWPPIPCWTMRQPPRGLASAGRGVSPGHRAGRERAQKDLEKDQHT